MASNYSWGLDSISHSAHYSKNWDKNKQNEYNKWYYENKTKKKTTESRIPDTPYTINDVEKFNSENKEQLDRIPKHEKSSSWSTIPEADHNAMKSDLSKLIDLYGDLKLYEQYIEHHGVKGQKWGVRNGPPYPIEDKTLAAGTRLNRIVGLDSNGLPRSGGKWVYTYNPDDKHDTKVYRGAFATFKAYSGSPYIMDMSYSTVKDLKLADSKDRYEGFEQVYNKYKKTAIKNLKSVQKALAKDSEGRSELDKRAINTDVRKLDASNKDEMYALFNHAMESAGSYKITKKYQKLMEKNFDGMVDDNNVNVYNDAHDPLIIFKSSMLKVEDHKLLSWDEIKSNTDALAKELNKKGQSVVL